MRLPKKSPHLLRVEEGPERFGALFAAAREAGLRVGWLELAPTADRPAGLPDDLEAAAGEGALRAVAAGGGRSVAVKPLRGEPVLRDLLREHFRGCALVLVRGEVEAPVLAAQGEDFQVTLSKDVVRLYSAAGMTAILRRPRPWSDSE
jgi:hypothetical protein